MITREYLPLEELAGWPYDADDNPPVITDVDIDVAAEIRDADEAYEHQRMEEREDHRWSLWQSRWRN
jgi:hypothetical protein